MSLVIHKVSISISKFTLLGTINSQILKKWNIKVLIQFLANFDNFRSYPMPIKDERSELAYTFSSQNLISLSLPRNEIYLGLIVGHFHLIRTRTHNAHQSVTQRLMDGEKLWLGPISFNNYIRIRWRIWRRRKSR